MTDASKIPAVRITLTRAEGPSYLCNRPREAAGPDVWLNANRVLRDWSDTAPKAKAGGGYNKCDFTVVYNDGETYNGRYDLKHHTAETPDLSRHMLDHLNCVSGRKIPSHMSRETWESVFAGDAELAAQFLDTYEVG